MLLSVGGERRPQQRVSEMITSALKFRRRGVSDPRFSCVGGASCPLYYSAVRDNRGGSREGRIRPHPLHFRPSCQERGGKDLIAAPSDALKIDHVTMQLFPDIFARGVLKRPGFHKTGVARLRRAPRWLRLLPAHAGSCAETGPSLCRLGRRDLSRPLASKAPGKIIGSRERECGGFSPSPAL